MEFLKKILSKFIRQKLTKFAKRQSKYIFYRIVDVDPQRY